MPATSRLDDVNGAPRQASARSPPFGPSALGCSSPSVGCSPPPLVSSPSSPSSAYPLPSSSLSSNLLFSFPAFASAFPRPCFSPLPIKLSRHLPAISPPASQTTASQNPAASFLHSFTTTQCHTGSYAAQSSHLAAHTPPTHTAYSSPTVSASVRISPVNKPYFSLSARSLFRPTPPA